MLVTYILATGAVSLAVTKSGLFEPVRKALGEKTLAGKLVRCPFCFAFWVSLALNLAEPISTYPIEFVAYVFAVQAGAALTAGAIYKLLA